MMQCNYTWRIIYTLILTIISVSYGMHKPMPIKLWPTLHYDHIHDMHWWCRHIIIASLHFVNEPSNMTKLLPPIVDFFIAQNKLLLKLDCIVYGSWVVPAFSCTYNMNTFIEFITYAEFVIRQIYLTWVSQKLWFFMTATGEKSLLNTDLLDVLLRKMVYRQTFLQFIFMCHFIYW